MNVKLVVIIPALNEEVTIREVIDRIPRSIDAVQDIEIIVVDDGSTDDTATLADQAGAMIIRHPTNQGVGVAFHSGLQAALQAGADVIVNMDADGQFRPEDITKLIRPIIEDGYGFATCTRFANSNNMPSMPAIKLWGNRMMCHIIGWVTGGPGFTDVSCGFRAYSRDTAMRMNLFGRFTYTQESFIDLSAKNIAMTEVPLVVRGVREHGESRVASNLWKYGFRSLTIILRALRDWRPLLFFGSLALSFLLLGIAKLGFVACYWLSTGRTTPWTSLITLGGISAVLGIAFVVLALIADQIGRNRKIQEELLYLQRKRTFDLDGRN